MKVKFKEITEHARKLSKGKILVGCKIGEKPVEKHIGDTLDEIKVSLSETAFKLLKSYLAKEQWHDFVALAEYNLAKM